MIVIECVEAAKPQQSDDKELLDRRVAALEVLEMHVQSLDNAISTYYTMYCLAYP